MANKQEMIVEIGTDGTVKLEVVGGDGKTCMDLTKDLERQIGDVKDRSYKPEWYKEKRKAQVKISS